MGTALRASALRLLFEGGRLGFTIIDSSAISGRTLSVAIPKGSMTATQRAAIESHSAGTGVRHQFRNNRVLEAIMYCDLCLRKGTVYLPTMGKMDKGFYRGVEPVAAVSASNTDALRQALAGTIARGNPDVPMLRRSEWAPPMVLKYAGVRSWSAFERGMRLWSIIQKNGIFQIVEQKKHPDGMWRDDPAQTTAFPAGSSADDVIERMIAIVQEAEPQQ